MKCPFCGHDETQVKDSRPSEEGVAIRRRRVCAGCEARFTTFERVQLRELTVLKGDGRKEVFDREKLLRSLRLPLQKRPVEAEQIERTVNVIISNLERLGENEIEARTIGQHVMDALRELDPVAYIRYASVYKDFREIDDFNAILGDIVKAAASAK